MNLKVVARYLGFLMGTEAVFLLPPVVVALIHGEGGAALALGASIGACLACWLVLWALGRGAKESMYAREAFVIAGLGWLLVSLLGALPFFISGEIPNYIDAFFESASGFTTTGASVLSDVEAMSRGLLFWRSLTHWLGGIGVLVFILAIVRTRSGAGSALHLLRAETPGPQVGKTMPKTRDSVRMLLLTYAGMSMLNLLLLLAGGMSLFDALCTMFGTAGTGGFGIKNDSMASYSPYLQNVTTVFMALFGVNFALYQLLLYRNWRAVVRDEELRLYLIIMLGSMAAVTAALVAGSLPFGAGLREGAFTVSSIMSTTGFTVADYQRWPEFTHTLILALMICGSMAGSTAGGFKIARVLMLGKTLKAGLMRLLHPRSVKPVRINGRLLDEDVLARNNLFLITYCMLLVVLMLLVGLDNQSLETDLSAVLACVNNVGPGLGAVGPTGNYSVYSPLSTLALTFGMLLGRLEIFPMLLLVFPATWKRKT